MAQRNSVMLATWHFHIEVSSKCTLACPRCARQEVPHGLVNTELDLEFFKRNFTPEFVLANVEKITFCGDDGDPIYAHDLIPIIQYLKSIKPVEIVIVTNGSHKKLTWWMTLGQSLSEKDSVHFSIDGYDNPSNNLYRVNSNYDSIISGLQTLRATCRCRIVWAAIAFKFNQDQIEYMQEFAKKLGVDVFQLTKSTKFGSVYPTYGVNDPLEPSVKYVSSTHRFEREIVHLTGRPDAPVSKTNIKLFKEIQPHNGIIPLCKIGNKGLYIDARGRLFPCCWVANRYSHNSEWQSHANNFNLHTKTLQQALADNFWTTELKTYKWQECQTKCSATVVDEKYATSW
jgi:MoaA/NifB/PqqE/SkfB family radical SAM enzyme